MEITWSEYKEWLDAVRLSDLSRDAKRALLRKIALLIIKNKRFVDCVKKEHHDVIKTLSNMIDASDPYTHNHSGKVMKYTMMVCKRMSVYGEEKTAIKYAALLHDIGKVFIDKEILIKKEKLTDAEWGKIREHPAMGAKVLSHIEFTCRLVPIIYHHHERFDGGGYPQPDLREGKIPLGSRIIAVCEAFEAMTSERPYRKAYSEEEAIKELSTMSGIQFDPTVVEAFTSSYKTM